MAVVAVPRDPLGELPSDYLVGVGRAEGEPGGHREASVIACSRE